MMDFMALVFISFMAMGFGYLAGFYFGYDTGRREERQFHDRYGRTRERDTADALPAEDGMQDGD